MTLVPFFSRDAGHVDRIFGSFCPVVYAREYVRVQVVQGTLLSPDLDRPKRLRVRKIGLLTQAKGIRPDKLTDVPFRVPTGDLADMLFQGLYLQQESLRNVNEGVGFLGPP